VASLTEVAAGGRALTQREAPRLSELAARLHGDVLQMATTFSDDTLEAQRSCAEHDIAVEKWCLEMLGISIGPVTHKDYEGAYHELFWHCHLCLITSHRPVAFFPQTQLAAVSESSESR